MYEIRHSDVRPRNRWETFHDIVGKFFSWEVAVLEKSAGFDFDVTDGSELFNESSEGMEGANWLYASQLQISPSSMGTLT